MNSPAPNKKLGQHWLHDHATLEAICDAADIQPTNTVLEIGPGLGTLTTELVKRAQKVIAVEFDERLAHELQARVTAQNLEVLQGDFLQFDLTSLPKDYKVVANVPYYITSKITRALLESPNPPLTTVMLVQKEVAQRMAAGPGGMSILAVAAQYYADVGLGMEVPAYLFTPPPQVDSQVVILQRRLSPLFDDVPAELFFRVVRSGFGEKRKKLRNSLSGGLQLDKADADKLLEAAGIAENTRAEELSLEAWHKLTKTYERMQP